MSKQQTQEEFLIPPRGNQPGEFKVTDQNGQLDRAAMDDAWAALHYYTNVEANQIHNARMQAEEAAALEKLRNLYHKTGWNVPVLKAMTKEVARTYDRARAARHQKESSAKQKSNESLADWLSRNP